ncbi:MAG: radical SAM protein [Clostridia bacterium]|nr:radical SAM protein [Clostridia bacterium]
MRNFYLVQAGCLYGDTYYLPYAAGMLAAFALNDERIKTAYRCGRFIYSLEDIDSAIASLEDPVLVGFSNSIWNYEYNLEFAKKLKQAYPDCLIEFGGHHIPPDTSYLENYPFVDVLTHGKGEEAFRDLLLYVSGEKDLATIPNISYRNAKGEPVKNAASPITITDYPSPYLSGLFDEIIRTSPYALSCVLETNRGCPYNCCYCDWGEINSPVRLFPLEKVFAEMDWMAAHKMEFVYCVDANFGMFERDLQIAAKLVDLKETFGYPNRLQVSYAKNHPERVFQINKLLADHGIGKGATLALQSLEPQVLENVGRANISKEEYMRRIAQFRAAGISTYTELILGLPGETVDSFCHGLCELLEMGQHSSVSAYHCELLPGSEMSTPSYMKKHGVKTVCTALDQFHCNDMSDTLSGYSNIVVGTNTMSVAGWVQCNFFAAGVQAFHHFGLTQCFAMYVRHECGVSYYDFYSALLAFIMEKTAFCRTVLAQVRQVLENFVTGKGALTIIDTHFGDITWPLEEAVFLKCLYQKETFFAEIAPFMRQYIKDEALYADLAAYQNCVVLHPDNNGAAAAFRYRFKDYFETILSNAYQPLQAEAIRYRFSTPFATKDWEEYGRLIVWYGRRNSRMLYSSAPNRIEEIEENA